jgi:hypothetical protein
MSPDRKAEILEQFFSLRPPDEGRQLEEGEPSPVRTPSKLEGMTVSEFAQVSVVAQAFNEELALALLALLPIEQQAPLLDRVAQRVKARAEEPFNSPEAQAIVDQMRARAIARLG